MKIDATNEFEIINKLQCLLEGKMGPRPVRSYVKRQLSVLPLRLSLPRPEKKESS